MQCQSLVRSYRRRLHRPLMMMRMMMRYLHGSHLVTYVHPPTPFAAHSHACIWTRNRDNRHYSLLPSPGRSPHPHSHASASSLVDDLLSAFPTLPFHAYTTNTPSSVLPFSCVPFHARVWQERGATPPAYPYVRIMVRFFEACSINDDDDDDETDFDHGDAGGDDDPPHLLSCLCPLFFLPCPCCSLLSSAFPLLLHTSSPHPS